MNSRSSNQTHEAQVPQEVISLISLIRTAPWQMILSSVIIIACFGYGLWLRTVFFQIFPDPFPTPDTWSYLTGTYGLLEKGQFDLFSLRTPGFPLLVWLVLVIFKSFAALNVIHSALTLLSAVAIAYTVRVFVSQWQIPSALAVGFFIVNPHLIYWEHHVMTEASFQSFFVLTLVATALTILRPTPGRAAAVGVLSAITILIRPQGLFLIPVVLLPIVWVSRGLARRELLWVVVAALAGPVLILGGWSARNAAVHGFFGLSNVGPLVNFGVSARWVDLDSPLLAEDKALIADSIRRYRAMPDDFNWVVWSSEGPVTLLSKKYANDMIRRDQVIEALAREAILGHPVEFVRRGFHNTYLLLTFYPAHEVNNFTYRLNEEETNWKHITATLPVARHRTILDQTRSAIWERAIRFNEKIRPVLSWEMRFIYVSQGLTLLAFLALPFLRGPHRLATAVIVTSVMLLILTAGFFCEPTERYLSVIHGSAVLAGALAITGLVERSRRAESLPLS